MMIIFHEFHLEEMVGSLDKNTDWEVEPSFLHYLCMTFHLLIVQDIPALAAQAAEQHTGVPYVVTAPIGLHELMVRVVEDRMQYCMSHVVGKVAECSMCAGTGRCQQLTSNPRPTMSTNSSNN
jgi:hypothetical protein